MSLKVRISREGLERVKLAMGQDNSIACSPDALSRHRGHSERYLIELGLTKSDLLRLERAGLAVRGYTQNYWKTGDTLPNGKEVPGEFKKVEITEEVPVQKGMYTRYEKRTKVIEAPTVEYRGRGHETRWVLVARGME